MRELLSARSFRWGIPFGSLMSRCASGPPTPPHAVVACLQITEETGEQLKPEIRGTVFLEAIYVPFTSGTDEGQQRGAHPQPAGRADAASRTAGDGAAQPAGGVGEVRLEGSASPVCEPKSPPPSAGPGFGFALAPSRTQDAAGEVDPSSQVRAPAWRAKPYTLSPRW